MSLVAGPASAQVNVLSPLFSDLNGGAVWGSIGSVTRGQGDAKDERPIWRAGFAAFYGPFGGGGDTLVTYTHSIVDSSSTTFAGPGGRDSTVRITRKVLESRAESKQLGRGGKVMLAAGYQHSAYYRIAGTPLTPDVSIGGIFLGAFLGPYQLPVAPKRFQWYAGLGGTIVRLDKVAGRVDTLAVHLTTERTFAPELHLMLTYMVRPGYRILVSGSYQYLRFGSVAYQPVEASDTIPGAVLAQLPSEIRLESWHVALGVSFAASSLIPSR